VLILLRHGRTAGNADGLLQGRLDLPLDDVGRFQAERVAKAVGPVDRIICSPMLRTLQTAEPFGVEPTTDDRWLELHYGEFDGKRLADLPPDIWHKWRTDPDFSTSGGESIGSLAARVRSACEELIELSRDEDILVVSHVTPIKAAVAWVLDAPTSMIFRCHLEQAAVCRVVDGPLGPVLRKFNEVLYVVDI